MQSQDTSNTSAASTYNPNLKNNCYKCSIMVELDDDNNTITVGESTKDLAIIRWKCVDCCILCDKDKDIPEWFRERLKCWKDKRKVR